jgi:MFS superfamily sulfate permease-like transporter
VVAGDALRLVFSAGLVLGAVVAALLVVRRDLLTVVFAPPLVYLVASAIAVLLGRGEGGGDIIDAAASWLVYGFPAMGLATGAAAVVAGVRARAR